MTDKSQLVQIDLHSLTIYNVEAGQVGDYELLDLSGESQPQIFDPAVSVSLVAGRHEKHGVGQHNLQMVSERSHVLAASLEAVNEDEEMVLFFICHTSLLRRDLLGLVLRYGTSGRLGQVIREEVTAFIGVDVVVASLFLCSAFGEDSGVRSIVTLNHDLVIRSELGVASHLSRLTE